jgi:hypothetical protein
MATFTINGFELRSEVGGGVTDMKGAELQVVSALGSATLAFSYVSDDPGSAEVSLSDYNILINGVHLNDGQLPERIELFKLNWMSETGPQSAQVMNFAFEGAGGAKDFLFSVGEGALPDMSDPAAIDALLSTANFVLMEEDEGQTGLQIQLDSMPGVSVSGVILNLFDDTSTAEQADTFHFFQALDADSFDAQAFDLDILAEDADASDPEPSDYAPIEPAPEYIPDPVLDDFGG